MLEVTYGVTETEHSDESGTYISAVDALASGAYQRFVLMLCTWACSPALIGATTLPMSTPYL